MNKSMVLARRRRRFSKAEQIRWVEEYWQSGLSQRDFALKHNLGFSSVQRWVSRHPLPAPSGHPGMKSVFTELQLPTMGPSARWAAEVVRRDGVMVRLAHDAPQALVWQLTRPC
jgi:transposase-like protein